MHRTKCCSQEFNCPDYCMAAFAGRTPMRSEVLTTGVGRVLLWGKPPDAAAPSNLRIAASGDPLVGRAILH